MKITPKGKAFYVVTMKDDHGRDVRRMVRDAAEPMTVHVQAPDIKGAVCKDHQKRVVANAIKRAKRAPWVDVGAAQVLVGTSETEGVRYLLNSLGREVVKYFDLNEGRAAPTSLLLTPAPASQKIGQKPYNRNPKKSRANKTRKPSTR